MRSAKTVDLSKTPSPSRSSSIRMRSCGSSMSSAAGRFGSGAFTDKQTPPFVEAAEHRVLDERRVGDEFDAVAVGNLRQFGVTGPDGHIQGDSCQEGGKARGAAHSNSPESGRTIPTDLIIPPNPRQMKRACIGLEPEGDIGPLAHSVIGNNVRDSLRESLVRSMLSACFDYGSRLVPAASSTPNCRVPLALPVRNREYADSAERVGYTDCAL